MKDTHKLIAQVLLLLLAIVGAGLALYLTSVHYEHIPLLCSAQGFVNCQLVTSSAYSVVPGTSVPITVPGLGWAIVSAILAVVGLRTRLNYRRVVVAQCIWSLVALITVLYLVYAELVLLHTICAWCTGFHVIILATFLIAMQQLLSPSQVEDEQEDEETPSFTPASKS